MYPEKFFFHGFKTRFGCLVSLYIYPEISRYYFQNMENFKLFVLQLKLPEAIIKSHILYQVFPVTGIKQRSPRN